MPNCFIGHHLRARAAKDRSPIASRPCLSSATCLSSAGRREPATRLSSGASVTLIPLPLVLLHIGPGVVLDVALLVPVFALLRVSVLRSAMPGSPCARREPIEPIPAAAQTFAPSEVGGS